MIDGHTQLVGLIGWPVEHTLSPAMHNAAFDALGLNWRYFPLPVPPEQVEAAVKGVVALGFRGVNVTVPHKQAVMPTLDSIAPNAKALGAVNTLVIERGKDARVSIGGHNTDALGFVGALRHDGFDPKGKSVVVVGAGGGARAVVYGLLEAGAQEILMFDLEPSRAQALATDLGGVGRKLRALPLTTEALVESARAADLLVNATPMGMWPRVDGSIWPDGVLIPAHLTVFDLVYNPLETRLLCQARESGACAIGGLGMLVGQGALAFEMWTGQPAPVEVMRTACEQAFRGESR
jgi:shikimate dehydrogenase